MVEIYDEDLSIDMDGTGTLSGHMKRDKDSPESIRRRQNRELESKIEYFRKMKLNEEEIKRKKERLRNKKKRYGSRGGAQMGDPEDRDTDRQGHMSSRQPQYKPINLNKLPHLFADQIQSTVSEKYLTVNKAVEAKERKK